MKKKERDELFAARLPGILQYHQKMLADGVRNKLLYQAIQSCVSKNTNFLDVGAGTGVWAILAAKLGAKRVVAIEIEECLIPIIFRHAQENGVADKIEIIHGNSDDVKIRGKFDVIVSELFGVNALGYETVKSFVSLRNRFLAKDGVLIPQKLSVFAVPVKIENSIQNVPAELPVSCDFLKSLKLNYSTTVSFAERPEMQLLGEPKELVQVDFRTVENAPSFNDLSGSWKTDNISEINAFILMNKSTFTDEIKMDNFTSQSWAVNIFEFQSFTDSVGEIKFDLTLNEKKSIWTVSLPSNAGEKSKTYTPAFALTRAKMAQQMTPFRKFNPPKNVNEKKIKR